jgi:hypothetical protein
MQYWFSLYQKLFHGRRLFRLLTWIIYTPMIRQSFAELQKEMTFKSLFALLGKPSSTQDIYSSHFSSSSTISQSS